ncbi:hypothetical protein [Actinoallomurus iriomotensis]|uniref:Uncharacterized protein n=1 Tax=Actinoallomurus iriomotensis TaxID=478107 RepID=A0A9W6RXE1_9ACTN|nr:hypothetical protein [Actinoallomurus iriomotensis]GLY81882.1 hypothetical protein Airi01_101490 [Actinoallomurus iriomotensis]
MTAPSRPDVATCPRCANNGQTIPVHARTRDGDEFEHRCPICHHEWTIVRTPQELAPPASHAALHRARTTLKHAALLLGRWHRGPAADPTPGAYITAGHDAIKRIDEALRDLYDARSSLISELRRNQDLQDLRVDAILAARRTPDTTTTPGAHTPEAAEQAHHITP